MTSRRHVVGAAVLAAIVSLLCVATKAQERSAVTLSYATEPLRIRLGYTAFENPRVVSADSGLHSIIRYLQHVSAQSRGNLWRRPVAFDVSVGNYYQIWSWFRRKQIDAALVSPFVAYLLERDGDALSVLEFREHCNPSGHRPLIAASGRWSNSPIDGYNFYLRELWTIASTATSNAEEQQRVRELVKRVRLNFVAHLSSSGFVMPALYAQEWLRTKTTMPLDSPQVATFWRLFIENARFSLQHGVQAPEGSISDLYFSYSGRPTERLASDRQTGQFAAWQGYFIDTTKQGPVGTECDRTSANPPPPEIPNDVLVIRRTLISEMFGGGRLDRVLLGDQLLRDPGQEDADSALFASNAGYVGVSWFSGSAHQMFRQRVEALFDSNVELRRTQQRWFERGWFDFTINETMGLLRQDQLNSRTSNLALVLSGGGVKSLYQTKLLDHLYGLDRGTHPMVSNFDPAAVVQLPIVDEIPLRVRNVIGTSGGAMLAYFAAQLPIADPPNTPLADILRKTTEQKLFPLIDVPRVVSFVVLMGVLFLALNLSRVLSRTWHAAATEGVEKTCPWTVYAIEAVFIVAGALVIVWARHPNQETARGVEGALYALLVALAHMSVSCISGSRANGRSADEEALRRGTIAGFGFGIMMTIAGLGMFVLTLANDPLRESQAAALPPLLAIGGLCVMSLALVTYAASGVGRLRLEWEAADRYFRGLGIAVLVIALSYLLVAIAAWSGAISTLELTAAFWQYLIGAGVLTSAAVIFTGRYSRTPIGDFLRAGTIELMRDRYRNTTTTLAGSLTSIAVVGMTCWTIIVAPAIYGNDDARSALRGALPSVTLDDGSFKSNLIVTGALLTDVPCPAARRTIPQGGIYFCFGGSAGCKEASRDEWQPFQAPPPRRALDAVFASGSPFPVFAPHSTRLPNGCQVPLVDGGYAHNLPLEAASITDARQILAINASPDPADSEVLAPRNAASLFDVTRSASQLVRFGSRILDFMFSRAQELDRSVASSLMVATLTPRPADGIWPFLLDFTPPTRDRMIAEANKDIAMQRRIGRIESWGFPVFSVQVGPYDRRLERRGWTPDVRRVLDPIIASAGRQTVVALDLDNTILRGDIGDAMLLKMIVERRYRGDDDNFWRLFPNQRAAGLLRNYWNKFRENPPEARYLDAHNWTPEFADYVVLFLRQYEEMLRPEDGGRRAYPWVVSLMGGVGADTVRSMASELWDQEMKRSAAPFSIHSRAYGDYEVQGGLRVHSEMKALIDSLLEKGAQVWIVTASSEWLGQQVAGVLGVPRERVLGMKLETPERFSVAQPETYRQGKVLALKKQGLTPTLALGDSMTDVEMLMDARRAIIIDRGKIPTSVISDAHAPRQPIDLLAVQRVP